MDVGRAVAPGDFVLQVYGRSMEDTIADRDYCLFRPGPVGQHLAGQVVLALVVEDASDEMGRPLVKRLRLQRSRVSLISDNEAFRPIEVADPTSVRVLARFMGVVQSG